MARLNSFYLAPEAWAPPYLLEGAEAHHLLKVLRTPLGARVRLFDGAGRQGVFLLAGAKKNRAYLQLEEELAAQPRPGGVTLALGWNKAARRGALLEKAVELEASGIAFWQAARSQGALPAVPKPSWTEKSAQAAKQCENPWLPDYHVVSGGAAGLAAFARGFDRCYLLWESEAASELIGLDDLGAGNVLVALGPEGGITDDEARILTSAGFTPRSLGRRVLRWETAALHCLGLAFHARQRSDFAETT